MHKDPERRRMYNTAYKRRRRLQRKVELARAREAARERREWLHARRLDNLTPMVLLHDLHLDDGTRPHTFPAGSVLYVLDGLAHLFERTLLATRAPQPDIVAPREATVYYRGEVRPLREVEAERAAADQRVVFRRVSPPVDPSWGDDEPED